MPSVVVSRFHAPPLGTSCLPPHATATNSGFASAQRYQEPKTANVRVNKVNIVIAPPREYLDLCTKSTIRIAIRSCLRPPKWLPKMESLHHELQKYANTTAHCRITPVLLDRALLLRIEYTGGRLDLGLFLMLLREPRITVSQARNTASIVIPRHCVSIGNKAIASAQIVVWWRKNI